MIKEATAFAEQVHYGAVRKGTPIPYITHPLEAAIIVTMMTGDEELIAAALLHDSIEDAGVTYAEIKQRFGTRVADLVQEESEDKSKSWIERKSATIEHLQYAGRDAKILALADKLSNIRSTARDYLLMGEDVWNRFHVKDKEQHAWYYLSMAEGLKELKPFPEYEEYVKLCHLVFGDGHRIFER
ncbi:MAG: HD domain-containing protein [Clostridium sp.]